MAEKKESRKQEEKTEPKKQEKKKPEVKKKEEKVYPVIAGLKVFGKWDTSSVNVYDLGLKRYIAVIPRITYYSFGRHASKKIPKMKISVIERLVNSLMRGGTKKKVKGHMFRNENACGKKMKCYKIVKTAFELIEQKTKKNPVEVLIRAIENSAPREETTRIKYGGITYHIAVDVAPQRRLDFALRNIAVATLVASHNNPLSAKQALASELIAAAENDPKSLAVARKDETERVARAAR